MIIFTRPSLLFLLLLVPIFVFVHIISMRGIKRRAIKFANFEAVSKISGVEIFSKNLTLLYLGIIIICLIIFSLSGLSLVRDIQTSSFSFVIAIDNSGSMGLGDLTPNRLEAAKNVAKDLIETFPDRTQVGLISFSSTPTIIQDLSTDKILIKDAINSISLGGFSGTDIFNAISASASLLSKQENKMIILISDGGANLNTIQKTIDYANNNEVIINSMSINLPSSDKEPSENIETLRIISENTRGVFYEVTDSESFYEAINKINETVTKKDILDLSFYLLLSALGIYLLSFVLSNLKYRSLP